MRGKEINGKRGKQQSYGGGKGRGCAPGGS